jgi:hypothetical protein
VVGSVLPLDKKAADPTKAKDKKDEKKENNEPEPLKEIDIPDNILTNEDKIVMKYLSDLTLATTK